MSRIRGGEDRERSGSGAGEARRHWSAIAGALVVLLIAVCATIGLGANTAAGDETSSAGEVTLPTPTAQQTWEALESSQIERLEQAPETDP